MRANLNRGQINSCIFFDIFIKINAIFHNPTFSI